MRVKEFISKEFKIENDYGTLVYYNAIPVEATKDDDCCESEYLWVDYCKYLDSPEEFFEIAKIEVKPEYRRKGHGTELVKEFFKQANPKTVLVLAGIFDDSLWNSLAGKGTGTIDKYIEENIVPFWTNLGFTDISECVDITTSVAMLWPPKKAKLIITKEESKHVETNLFT